MNEGGAEERIAKAEEIIRAQHELIEAMYDGDRSDAWPRRHHELIQEYNRRYGVDLDDW